TSLEIGFYRRIDVAAIGIHRIRGRVVQGRRLVRLLFLCSGIVVTVDGEEIHLSSGSLEIDVDVLLRVRWRIEGQDIFLARRFRQSAELRAELLEQSGEVLLVRRAGKLPIDIEAVKQARTCNRCSDVPLDKHIDARRGERSPATRGGCGGHEAGNVARLSTQ